MKISIAMATYNGAKHLQEQLDSFLKQIRPPDEVVVCDDGSSDNTIDILEKFRDAAPFDVEIHQNENNTGFVQSFGTAISLCRGDLIFLSDQDDYWLDSKLAVVEKAAFDDEQAVLFINDATIAFADLASTGSTLLGRYRAEGIPDSSLKIGCCVAVRGWFAKKLLPFPKQFVFHDEWLVGFADGLGRKKIVENSLQLWRRHGSCSSKFSAWDRTPEKIRKLCSYAQAINVHRRREQRERALMSKCFFMEKAKELKAEEELEYIHDDIVIFIRNLERKINVLVKRLDLREKNIFMRVVLGATLLKKRAYNESGGVKAYLGDVLGL